MVGAVVRAVSAAPAKVGSWVVKVRAVLVWIGNSRPLPPPHDTPWPRVCKLTPRASPQPTSVLDSETTLTYLMSIFCSSAGVKPYMVPPFGYQTRNQPTFDSQTIGFGKLNALRHFILQTMQKQAGNIIHNLLHRHWSGAAKRDNRPFHVMAPGTPRAHMETASKNGLYDIV